MAGKTEAIEAAGGGPIYVPSPTRGYGSRPLRRCTRCGAEVVWAERGVEGRVHLVEVREHETQSGAVRRWYAPWIAHRCGRAEIARLEAEYRAFPHPRRAAEIRERLAELEYEFASPEERREIERAAAEERSERIYASSYGLGL